MIEYTNICIQEYNKLSYKKRKEKPFCIEYDGTKEWIVDGILHREDGPAAIFPKGNLCYPKGHNKWCLDGKQYSFEDWCEKLNKSKEEIIFLKLKYL